LLAWRRVGIHAVGELLDVDARGRQIDAEMWLGSLAVTRSSEAVVPSAVSMFSYCPSVAVPLAVQVIDSRYQLARQGVTMSAVRGDGVLADFDLVDTELTVVQMADDDLVVPGRAVGADAGLSSPPHAAAIAMMARASERRKYEYRILSGSRCLCLMVSSLSVD
jgi:hypothetical protein